jgi:exodeoxyribonuclease V beta subunit
MTPRRVARPRILRELAVDRHAVLEASAGTGKTFALEHLVVDLLLRTDASLDQLLVVTFTEKATAELRARVRAKLEALLSGSADAPLATEEQIREGDFWTMDAAALARVGQALRAFDGATISTIHAFCQRVLRENAFASGRLFEETQVDGRAEFGRALRETMRRHVAGDAERGPWLEEALRCGWSIEEVEKLLWACHTSRGELRPGLDLPALREALERFPVDAACRNRAEREADLKGWGVHARTAGTIPRRLFDVAAGVEAARESGGLPRWVAQAPSDALGYLLEKLPTVQSRPGETADLVTAGLALARATPPFDAALAQILLPIVVAELTRTKRAVGRYDFDDMLALVDEALRGPQGRALAVALRRRWPYALVDEFQDTDETQWEIFRRALFEPLPGAPPSVLFLVGDPKQSIYRFRGADVETYLRARDEVARAGGARATLDRNYRATRALVDAVNRIFDAGAPDPIFGGSIAYAPVACGRPDRTMVDGDGRPVSPVHAFRFRGRLSLEDLGALIAREIRAITDPARPWKLDGTPVEHHQIYVLTRTLLETRIMGAVLRGAGVPYAYYKDEGLLQTAEAQDVLVLLSAIDEPGDRAARVAAWLTPFFGLPLDGIERARDLPPSHPLVARLHAWKALAEARDFDALFESVLVGSGLIRREIFFRDGERELTNYLHVLELLLERTRGAHVTLRELVRELSGLMAKTRMPLDVEANMQRLESERRAVQVMTMHKAKGLEAPVVFVAGGFSRGRGDRVHVYHDQQRRLAWVGSLASPVEGIVKQEAHEEDQRLAYVALTRAQGRLYVPCVVADPATAKSAAPGGGHSPAKGVGAFDAINRRVVRLADEADEAITVEDASPHGAESPRPPALHAIWRPPAELLDEPAPQGRRRADLLASRAAPIVTSYTRLRGQRGAPRAGWIEEAGDRRAEKGTEGGVCEDPGTTLRAARSSGVFLHEVLERLPIASFLQAEAFESWRERADVAAVFAESMAAYGVERAQREHSERIAWAAYTTALDLPTGDRIDGLARAARLVREMAFVFPIPEPHHPPLEAAPVPLSRAGTGFVRGSLDLAFEHRGRTYFIDWKSDSLASYDPLACSRVVTSAYEQQVELYTLAIVRLLGLRGEADYEARFGGLLYCFLRGLDGRGQGVWSARPPWDAVVGWDARLRAPRWWAAEKDSWTE